VIRRALAGALVGALLTLPARAAQDEEQDGPPDPSLLPGASDTAQDVDDDEDDEDDEDGADDEASRDPIVGHRTEFDVLMDRTIGTASRPSAFNWRRTNGHIAGLGSFLGELNNFNSGRVGLLGRLPTGGTILELGVTYVFVGDTESSRQLALTPYRQPGRPPRLDVDINLGLPLAEGVVTVQPRFFPAVQLVLNGYVGLRYAVYPQAYRGLRFRQVAAALVSPQLSQDELDNMEGIRKQAMQVDPARYHLMLGLGNDIYFRQGLFLSPRIQFAVPVLAPATDTDLLFWTEASLAIGVAL